MSLSWLPEALEELSRQGLLREPRTLSSATGPEALVDGRSVLLFCSNDYLGLSDHDAVKAAAIEATTRWGVGACSSRLISGTHDLHRQLEERLAIWIGVEKTLLFPAGFMANLAVLSTLPRSGDVIFSDALNHASIIRGCRLSQAEVVVYPHGDVDTLDHLMSHHSTEGRRYIVSDALFSVDGDEAELAALGQIASRLDATLMIDEAHSLGVLGPSGRGLCAAAQVTPDVLVGTLGKAFGCAGAFVAGSTNLVRYLESRAAPFIFTTAPPPALPAAAMAALDLIVTADDARARLLAHADALRSAFQAMAVVVEPSGRTVRRHIVPALVPGVDRVVDVANELFRQGVFVQALRPPTVPARTERLRWTPTSRHTSEQIDHAVGAFAKAIDSLGARRGGVQ